MKTEEQEAHTIARLLKPAETVAENLHAAHQVISEVEDFVSDTLEKYEPELYSRGDFDFDVGSDYYDNSIEIYIKCITPSTYIPCKEAMDAIYGLGFNAVYWNFIIDDSKKYKEEICGRGARRTKSHV